MNLIRDCAFLTEAVTARREGTKERLAGLLHKLDREESISRRILDEVSITRKLGTGSLSQVENIVRIMGMQELNTTNPVKFDQQKVSPSQSPRRQVFTKPLPSIRQLPTLSVMVAGTLQQQGGMTPAAQNRGVRGGRVGEEGDFERSCKSVGRTFWHWDGHCWWGEGQERDDDDGVIEEGLDSE